MIPMLLNPLDSQGAIKRLILMFDARTLKGLEEACGEATGLCIDETGLMKKCRLSRLEAGEIRIFEIPLSGEYSAGSR